MQTTKRTIQRTRHFSKSSPENDYTIRISVPEFTCLCPLTGQPDFANFVIEYVPEAECVELKALKMYFWSFREEGGFHEKLTNDILNKLVEVTQPRFMRMTANWNVRGRHIHNGSPLSIKQTTGTLAQE